jgi:hypothetical protein
MTDPFAHHDGTPHFLVRAGDSARVLSGEQGAGSDIANGAASAR